MHPFSANDVDAGVLSSTAVVTVPSHTVLPQPSNGVLAFGLPFDARIIERVEYVGDFAGAALPVSEAASLTNEVNGTRYRWYSAGSLGVEEVTGLQFRVISG